MRRRRTPVDYHGEPLQADEVYVAVASYATDRGAIRRGHEMRGDDPRLADHAARFIRRGSPMPAADVATASLARDVAAPEPTTRIVARPTDEDWLVCVRGVPHAVAAGERRLKSDPTAKAHPNAFVTLLEHRARERDAERARTDARAARRADPRDANGQRLVDEQKYVALGTMAIADPSVAGGVTWVRDGDRRAGTDPVVRATSTRWAPVTT